MKRVIAILLILFLSAALFTSCGNHPDIPGKQETETDTTDKEKITDDKPAPSVETEKTEIPKKPVDGVNTLEISCAEGTDHCWSFDGGALRFSGFDADTVCAVSGEFDGNIEIDAGDGFRFELEMRGLSLWCSSDSPITVLSGDKVTLTAKKETKNYLYDTREEVTDEEAHAAAIFAECDLEIGGKGELTVISSANNGIHTKDDLEIKNLTLSVTCEDNALKGNDSVTVNGGTLTLISRIGDCIKTTNTDVSSKGNQRGTVTLAGSALDVYAACDGIDAAYNVEIGEDTVLNVYTDKYSPYSGEVTAVDEDCYYIRFTSKNYAYSVKYYNSDNDFKWANAAYKTSVNAGRGTYYYYSVPKETGYEKVQFFIYSSAQAQGQEDDYLVCSDYLTWNTAYDTFALTQNGSSLSYSWTNYTTTSGGGRWGGPGGMMDGNPDKGDHSAKGIKAGNEILVDGGTVFVKSYDDAIHANKDTTLENGETPAGNVTVSGGTLELYSNDDGIHADGVLTVSGGTISVTNSYEGVEGSTVLISGGDISITSKDDGINATATSGTGIKFEGGNVYIYAGGDGIDANSRTSYQGIIFAGGDVTVISTSSGNSSIDTEQGYTYTGGRVLAICPSGGMGSESTKCQNFSSIGTKTNLSLKSSQTLSVKVGGKTELSVKMPSSLSALVIYLGASGAAFTTE